MTIFRKVALERLSSPEQLDQLIRVTDPRGWVGLVTLGLLVAAALVWSLAGSLPTAAVGTGILLRQGGVADLEATGAGQVEEILVAVGDEVGKGQVVARIRQEALERQIEEARTKKADQEEEYKNLLAYADEQMRLTEAGLAQQRANLSRTIETLGEEAAILEERVASEEALLKDGLITRQTLLDTRQRLNATRDEIATRRLERNGLELKRLEARQQLDQQIEARRTTLLELELRIRDLEAQLEQDVTVVSPYAGRVLELTAARGDVVAPGTAILSLEIFSEDLLAVLFVPAADGKQIRPGMEAQISPSIVKREEFGYILGEVLWVAEFPATSRGMRRLLANDELVARLLEGGTPIQVNVALARDAATETGYRWSSGEGPGIPITSGTLAGGSVIIRRDRPISLLIPKLREKLGL